MVKEYEVGPDGGDEAGEGQAAGPVEGEAEERAEDRQGRSPVLVERGVFARAEV